jgi:hypothetical protein
MCICPYDVLQKSTTQSKILSVYRGKEQLCPLWSWNLSKNLICTTYWHLCHCGPLQTYLSNCCVSTAQSPGPWRCKRTLATTTDAAWQRLASLETHHVRSDWLGASYSLALFVRPTNCPDQSNVPFSSCKTTTLPIQFPFHVQFHL